ncbi:unnamed protein product [Lupinus luteus]|uniref:Uncharacterized protein n=1 Tax=Lupinus luteus TaxID=3873 RepID=A0AAV1X4I9_LUPLU
MESLEAKTSMKKAMWLYAKVLGSNPSERWGHSACFSNGFMYVFGGCCGGMHFCDIQCLDFEKMAWSKVATTGQKPGPRDSHSAVLVGHKMIVFGGTNGFKKVNDTHILDLVTKEWIRPICEGTPPSPRESHTATLVGDERLVIFGGSGEGDANYLNDLYILDLRTMRWSFPEVKGDLPVPRDSHIALAIRNKLFVYGGDCGDKYHGDVNMLDMETMTWSRIHGQHPQGRFSHTAVVADKDIAIYGGCGEDERSLNELLVLQLGAEHRNRRYNISMCKVFGAYWKQEKNAIPRRVDTNEQKTPHVGNNVDVSGRWGYEVLPEKIHPHHHGSGTLQQKRKRIATSRVWDVESEQEHSLSLSQHSSPSQSDQEQTPSQKANAFFMDSQRYHLLKHINKTSSNWQHNNGSSNKRVLKNMAQTSPHDLHLLEHQPKQEQFLHIHEERKGHKQNLDGAEFKGKIDGAFDSGLLMTASVNGRIFRGVLFAPGEGVVSSNVEPKCSLICSLPYTQPLMNSNHVDSLRASQKVCTSLHAESCHGSQGDLQGLVLTLGGPASGNHV